MGTILSPGGAGGSGALELEVSVIDGACKIIVALLHRGDGGIAVSLFRLNEAGSHATNRLSRSRHRSISWKTLSFLTNDSVGSPDEMGTAKEIVIETCVRGIGLPTTKGYHSLSEG